MTTLDIICTVRIGYAAYGALSRDQPGHVMGVTSRGVFVWLDEGPVVFVSAEPYVGPLTIVLPGTGYVPGLRVSATEVAAGGPLAGRRPTPTDWRDVHAGGHRGAQRSPAAISIAGDLQVGSPALVRSGQLVLPDAGLAISAAPEDVWRAPPVTGPSVPLARQLDMLRGLARAARASGRDQGLGAWLPHLLETGVGSRESGVRSRESGVRAPVSRLPTPDSLLGLLGKGCGLTPSGDDVVIGLLLAVNRWQAASWEAEHLGRFNRAVVEAAYGKTTRLSANLIECAARGEADERLIGLVDGVFAGVPDQAECASYMLGWGGSSGINALVGMAVAVVGGCG